MAGSHRSSVYDLSNLLLHTDGSRVTQSSKNANFRRARNVVRDSRGYWLARDATGKMPLVNRVISYEVGLLNDAEDVEGEEMEEDDAEDKAEQSGEDEDLPKGRKRKSKKKDYRRAKRKRFADDLSFVGPGSMGVPMPADAVPFTLTNEQLPPSQNASLALPSSDLLKGIHYFAAQYYNERGLLKNTAKEDREERKLRKKEGKEESSTEVSSEDEADESGNEDEEYNPKQPLRQTPERPPKPQVPEDEGGESSSEGEKTEPKARKVGRPRTVDYSQPKPGGPRRKPGRRPKSQVLEEQKSDHEVEGDEGVQQSVMVTRSEIKRNIRPQGGGTVRGGTPKYRDMYKVFDGSVLIAIAMLLQEQIVELLTARVPEGWEEGLRAAYAEGGVAQQLREDETEVVTGFRLKGSRKGKEVMEDGRTPLTTSRYPTPVGKSRRSVDVVESESEDSERDSERDPDDSGRDSDGSDDLV